MSDEKNAYSPDHPTHYQIVVKGQLDSSWTEWFDGFMITVTKDESGRTLSTLTGVIADQGALYGIIARLRDLGLELLEIRHQ